MNKIWSQTSRTDTLDKLTEGDFGFSLEGVAFKHIDGPNGIISIEDIVQGNYAVRNRSTGEVTQYESAEALVEAGWVLD